MAESKNCINLQIKVYPEEKARFLKLKDEMDEVIKTDRDAFISLMDFYENPKEIKVDNPELIKKNQELQEEIEELQEANKNLVAQLENLESKLKSLDDEKAQRPDNLLEVVVHPVAFEFLKKMAAHQTKVKGFEVTPGDILVNLFLCDLQNPRANNLPYIVPTSEIRAKFEEYKKQHPEEYESKR